jgi:hypothetical protein
MSSASPLHQILAALADDPYWGRPGSTGLPPTEVPDRRATRTEAAGTYNLTWHALQQDHERTLADFVARHGDPAATYRQPVSVYTAAGIIAAADPAAAAERALIDEEGRLRTAIAIGEGQHAIGHITCPACACWSLTPARGIDGWHAVCLRHHCTTPDGRPTWSLRDIAGHHLRTAA